MTNASPKSTFALFFGNRGFFPASLIASAREELTQTLTALGHKTLALDAGATRHGAVETPAEGRLYAKFLREHDGEYDGVILCLPNFGDETGAVAALKEAGVPILIQAYPDSLDKMAPEVRRDAFCGKFSIMDVFCQSRVQFTALPPHTVAPGSAAFAGNVDHFDRVCRVVKGLKSMVVGAVGARTSAFKTVRIDELALQSHGITMETYDLSDIMAQMRSLRSTANAYKDKAQTLKQYADFSRVPEEAMDKLVRLGVVLDKITAEGKLDALALRCWVEMQQQLGISPCVLLSEMNNRRIPAACEVDVANAVAMRALSLASGEVATCLDWNNNYGEEENKCILFHCGPVPQAMMTGKGLVRDHAILNNAPGISSSFGCNVGRIKPTDFTFSSMTTVGGRLEFYAGEGRFTADPIAENFFGCAGVAEIPRLQEVLLHIGYGGHRHHVGVTPRHIAAPLREALGYYLGHPVAVPQSPAAPAWEKTNI